MQLSQRDAAMKPGGKRLDYACAQERLGVMSKDGKNHSKGQSGEQHESKKLSRAGAKEISKNAMATFDRHNRKKPLLEMRNGCGKLDTSQGAVENSPVEPSDIAAELARR